MKPSIKSNKLRLKSKLIRSFALLLTTFSYQGLILLSGANFSRVAAQTTRLCAVPGKDGPGISITSIYITCTGKISVNNTADINPRS
ncbi:MAG: hypothetical protein AAGM40_16520, partial [Cyanobacteria bacterium J06573_2]